jgi:hypothetical protein
VLAIVALVLLGILAVFACAKTFSQFPPYDDEGLLMISVQGFLSGHALYDQVLTFYGPFYYLYEWFIHAVARLPLTDDVTRTLCIFHWLLASSVLALAAGRITRSAFMGLLVFVQAVLHLVALAFEPGHPQELVALLLALAALVAVGGVQKRWTFPLLGAIGAALVLTKVNVGAFFGCALALAMCSRMSLFQARPTRFWALLVLASLLPFVLMRHHLSENWARIYAAQECAAILAAGAAARAFASGPSIELRQAALAGASFAIVAALAIAVLALTGSSFSCVLDNLVAGPAANDVVFYSPLKVAHSLPSAVAALLGAAAMVRWRSPSARRQFVIATAKALYGCLGILMLICDYSHYTEALGWLLPWSWLLLLPNQPGDLSADTASFARVFLCFQAVWQGLQAYPFPGSQTAMGTFLPVLAYSVCLHDAMQIFLNESRMIRRLGTIRFLNTLLIELLGCVALICFTLKWLGAYGAWRDYRLLPPLALPGSTLLHLPPAQVEVYRKLTHYLGTHSDAFISIPGFNSLYFWTAKNPPTYFNATEVVWMNEDQQSRIIAALQKASHPMIILFGSSFPPLNSPTIRYVYPAGPLPGVIRDQCREIIKIGPFRILALEKTANVR